MACVSIGASAPIGPVADGGFDAAISTHALLHGTPASIAARLGEIARALRPGGLFFATFGSVRDARFGRGTRIDASTWAPESGDERGVAHAYFAATGLRALLARDFAVERADENGVDDVAGTWAHATTPLRDAVHWFVEARRRD